MAIYTFNDAKHMLRARLRHRTAAALPDAPPAKYIDQAQYLIATNVRDQPAFDVISAPKALVIGQTDYAMGANFSITDCWGIDKVRLVNEKLTMHHGDWETYISMGQIPSGLPSMW